MVAYSFQRQFVNPIRLGLRLEPLPAFPPARAPKLHTIRAIGKRRHARLGEMLQLYYGQRTKQCISIGTGRCTKNRIIRLYLKVDIVTWIEEDGGAPSIGNAVALDAFAVTDGFADWVELKKFWREQYPAVDVFNGRMIEWEGLAS